MASGRPSTDASWSFVAAIGHKGDNRYNVVATKAGHPKDKTTAVVTRNLSAAEKAVIRQEKAERRANRRALAVSGELPRNVGVLQAGPR